MHNRKIGSTVLLAGVFLLAATFANSAGAAPAAKWRTLFDGKLQDTFRGWRADGMPEGWRVVDGTLVKDGHAATGIFYLVLSVAVGLVVCALGVLVGRTARPRATRSA